MGIKFVEAERTSAQGNYFGKASEREFHGIATESCTKAYVYQQFRAFVWDGLLYDSHGVPLADDDGIQIESDDPSGRYWLCRVRYETPEPTQVAQEAAATVSGVDFGAFPVGFTTTGGTTRLYRSFATTRYNVNGTAPDFGGMIGWNGEEFEGVEIPAPKLAFSIQKRSPVDAVTNFASFAVPLASRVGRTNADYFYGFSPGVVLFMGVSSGSLQKYPGDDSTDPFFYWDVKCEFAASPDSEFTLGSTTITKPGWDCYWTLTDKSYNSTTGLITPTILGAYVERCYERADFSWFES